VSFQDVPRLCLWATGFSCWDDNYVFSGLILFAVGGGGVLSALQDM
jgi:hypothetical protein